MTTSSRTDGGARDDDSSGRTTSKPAYSVLAVSPMSAIASKGRRCLCPRHDRRQTARSPVGARFESTGLHWSKP